MKCGALHSVAVFFFNDTATTEIYTLSLHDALPISRTPLLGSSVHRANRHRVTQAIRLSSSDRSESQPASSRGLGLSYKEDRKSTRLNSSHANISYAVFCLKKKNPKIYRHLHDIATN